MAAAERIESFELAPDGVALRTMRWQPAEPAWAALLLVHGVGEHAGRYDHVGRQMAAAGIDVHAFDLRGFGASSGPRAYVERWSLFHDDLQARLSDVRAVSHGLPVVLYGHSMGGLIVLGYVLATIPRPLPDLMVLSCPGLDSTIAALEAGRRTDPGTHRPEAPGPERIQRRKPVARSGGGCAPRHRSARPAELHRSAGRRGLRRAGSRPRTARQRCTAAHADLCRARQR